MRRKQDPQEPAASPKVSAEYLLAKGDGGGIARGATTVIAHPIDRPEGVPLARIDRARGGVSMWSVVSGTLVAFGAFVVLSAVVGAFLASSGLVEGFSTADSVASAGLAVLVGVLMVQFWSYFWGGYAAGRMARGSGWANGALVAAAGTLVVATLIGLWIQVGGSGAGFDGEALQAFPLQFADLRELATGSGIALLIVMLLGGALGGQVGASWHNKLEDTQLKGGVR